MFRTQIEPSMTSLRWGTAFETKGTAGVSKMKGHDVLCLLYWENSFPSASVLASFIFLDITCSSSVLGLVNHSSFCL